MDGTGKTTQAKLLKEHLENRKLSVLYLHRIANSLSNRLAKTVSKTTSQKKGERSDFPLLNKKIRHLAFIFDLIYFKLMMNKHLRSSDILICDRYFFDNIIQLRYLGVLGEGNNPFFFNSIPSPNICFFLNISPEEAFEREGEHELNYYQKKSELYTNFFENIQAHVIEGESIEDIHRRIVEIVDSSLNI